MNTLFCYLYSDEHNYKKFNEVIINGILNYSEIEPYLHEGTFFIPSEVNLSDLQELPLKKYDHIWHTIDFIAPSKLPATTTMDAKLFLSNFKVAYKKNWNEVEVFKRFGML